MARLNLANPAVLNARQTPSKQASSPSKKTTRSGTREVLAEEEKEINTRFTSPKKSATAGVKTESTSTKTSGSTSKKAKGSPAFDIFEDEEGSAPEDSNSNVYEDLSTSRPQTAKTKLPLRHAHSNSITSLSRASKQKQSRSEESEDEDDKENRLVEDEAEEASEEEEEEEEHSDEGEELGAESDEDAEAQEFGSPKLATRESKTTRRNANDQKFTRYREPQEESETETEQEPEHDDDFDSLDGFIVSDSEDISYHESLDGLPDDSDLEIGPPSPKPRRRRLIRGRRPSRKVEHSSHWEDAVDPFQRCQELSPPKSESPPIIGSKFTPLFPHDRNDGKTKHFDENDDIKKHSTQVSRSSQSDSLMKKNHQKKMATPPSSPSKVHIPSPAKTKYRIPPSPHRESSDAFWSQEVTNDWNDQFSPRKERTPGRALQRLLSALGEDVVEEGDSSASSSPLSPPTDAKAPKSPSKKALKKAEAEKKKAILARKKSFDNKKAGLAEEFLKFLDDKVSGGQVQKLAAETGGIKIIWSKTLQTTAGRANWRREKPAHRSDEEKKAPLHHASIELAERIIDSEDRLLNTLAHEYCHLANFMISNVRNNPHGASFKEWGRKCTEALRDHPVFGGRVEVTTKHSYKIDYKYVWLCVDCGQEYGRHSKSIDPTKSRCGLCKGMLQQIKPKPRNVSPKKNNINGTTSSSSVSHKLDDVTRGVGKVSLSG